MLRAPIDPLDLPRAEQALDTQQRLGEMLEQHYRHVWRCLRGFGVFPGQVDDAAQQVFLIASKRLAEIALGKERAFLTATAVRVAANARRSQERHPHAEPEQDALLELVTPEALLERKRLRELLDRVLDSLPLELRQVLVLIEIEGATRAETADLLAIPEGTVASRLKRARELFQTTARELQSEGERP